MPDSHTAQKRLNQSPDTGTTNLSSARFPMLALACAYTLFVIYGSLVPFDYQYLSWQDALDRFKNIPYLDLGIGSRADWVANILLYIPLAFLWLGTLWKSNSVVRQIAAALFVLIACTSLNVAIEFTQVFFPPRTVSLNDIIAEITGTILGIAIWPLVGMHLVQLVQTIYRGGTNARNSALTAYALAYVVLSLFPYDFLLTQGEWQAHLASDAVGWLFAPSCGNGCAWKVIPEIIATTPLGILVALALRSTLRVPLFSAALAGALLGILIEGLQLTIASGISQGASVGSRAAGMTLGVWLAQSAHAVNWVRVRQLARGVLILGMLPYMAMLAWLNHWFSDTWLGFSEGSLRIGDIHFLPFYYHYYNSESKALVSLLYQAGLYAPIGAAVWLWHWAGPPGKPERSLISSAFSAGTLASVIESGKLFITSQHPDPTNVLIAVAAAMTAYQLLQMMFATTPIQSAPAAHPAHESAKEAQRPHWARIFTGTGALCVALIAAVTSPLGAAWVLLPLVAYAMFLWWRPDSWLVWILALLPLLDLTPWTGRLYWTEYDTLLLVTLGVGYLRLGSRFPAVLPKPAGLLLSLFGLSAMISLGIGIWPLGPLDNNAFASYTSSYNALRAVKGVLFAFAFFPLLAHEWGEPKQAARRFAFGMTLGLAAEVLCVLWERVTFTGLFNFESGYRITGTFPRMHIGGAYIEGYLVTALPFVALWAWQQRHIGATVLATGLYGLGAYSVMVTYSRGGQAAFALATLILLLGFVYLALRDRARRLLGISTVVLITGAAMALAWPVFSGKFSQSRISSIAPDFVTRSNHWADVLHIFRMQNSPIFGVGLGKFASAYFWGSRVSSRPSTYAFITEDGNTFLQLGNGEPMYFEQPVAVEPEQQYMISMDLRSSANNAELTVPVCEKGLLYSFTCIWTTLHVKAPPGQWGHYEAQIQTRNFGPPNSRFPRPVKLSLYNGQAGTLVDVDNVSLRNSSGNNLVRNGDFSEGMHHWFYSTDSHLAWHAKNLYLHVLFEQGWLGLICFMLLVTYTLARLLLRAWDNDPASLAIFASLTAFLVVGMVDSLIDETRLGFLFFTLLIAGLMAVGQPARPRNAQTG